MKHQLVFTAALAFAAIPFAASAGTTHTGTSTGPRGGVWSSSSGTSCGGHACTHNGSVTSPTGNQASSSSNSSCANGACNRSAARTGFRGRSASHSGSVSR